VARDEKGSEKMATSTFTNNLKLTSEALKKFSEAFDRSRPLVETMLPINKVEKASKDEVAKLIEAIKNA
jgi:hypothetical protein